MVAKTGSMSVNYKTFLPPTKYDCRLITNFTGAILHLWLRFKTRSTVRSS